MSTDSLNVDDTESGGGGTDGGGAGRFSLGGGPRGGRVVTVGRGAPVAIISKPTPISRQFTGTTQHNTKDWHQVLKDLKKSSGFGLRPAVPAGNTHPTPISYVADNARVHIYPTGGGSRQSYLVHEVQPGTYKGVQGMWVGRGASKKFIYNANIRGLEGGFVDRKGNDVSVPRYLYKDSDSRRIVSRGD
jgi:hypothetical protein